MLKTFLDDYKRLINSMTPDELADLDFSGTIDSDILYNIFKAGYWSILFLGSTTTDRYGLRIVPGQDWRKWPVVKMNDLYSCTTIGPGPASLFEFIDFDAFSPDFSLALADYFIENSVKFTDSLSAYKSIFNDNEGIQFFNDFALQVKKAGRSPANNSSDRTTEFWSFYDTSVEHRFLRTSITKMMDDNNYLPEINTAKDYGIWRTRLYHLSMCRIWEDHINNTKISQQLIINCFDEPHFVDPADVVNIRQSPDDSADPSFLTYQFVEKIMNSNAFADGGDPLYHAMQMLYEKGSDKYNGVTHAELAAVFDEQCHAPLRSWNALINAAYWSGRNMDESLFPTWEAAISLCKRNNWADAQYALEYQMGIYKELKITNNT